MTLPIQTILYFIVFFLTFANFVQNAIIRFIGILKIIFRKYFSVFKSCIATVYGCCFGLQNCRHGFWVIQTAHSCLKISMNF